MRFKHFMIVMISLAIITTIAVNGCERSEGLKYGTLQKVSHKGVMCKYYVAEFSYEGGRVEGDEKSKAYSNTQEIEIDKVAFDSLQNYLGDKVIFDYTDRGYVACGLSKKLTSIKRKSN